MATCFPNRSLARDRFFRRPFLASLMLRVLGLDWSGFFIMGSYLVAIVKASDVPLDSFVVSAGMSSYRILLAVVALFYMSKVKMKSLYIATSILHR